MSKKFSNEDKAYASILGFFVSGLLIFGGIFASDNIGKTKILEILVYGAMITAPVCAGSTLFYANKAVSDHNAYLAEQEKERKRLIQENAELKKQRGKDSN